MEIQKNIKDEIKSLMICIGGLVIILGLLVLTLGIWDVMNWNGGYHSSDGGRWVYVQAVGHSYDTDYLYECEKCGYLQEFNVKR